MSCVSLTDTAVHTVMARDSLCDLYVQPTCTFKLKAKKCPKKLLKNRITLTSKQQVTLKRAGVW